MSINAEIRLKPDALYPFIHALFKNWQTSERSLYEPFRDWLIIRQSTSASSLSLPAAVQQVVLSVLSELAQHSPNEAHLIKARFIEQNSIKKLALEMNCSVDALNRLQRAALKRLAGMLAQKEQAFRSQQIKRLEHQLPSSPYSRFIGQTHLLAQLIEAVTNPNAPYLIAAAGLGGIGKTALADAVARAIINRFHFAEVVWIRVQAHSLKNQHLNVQNVWRQVCQEICLTLHPSFVELPLQQQEIALQQALKEKSCFVVVDNLEEPKEVQYVLTRLTGLANPSRFLITSRYRPVTEPGLLVYAVDELDLDDSLALIRQEAQDKELADLADAKQAQLLPIYHLTGGNPLALKLVVGLASAMPLAAVLADLKQSCPGPTAGMYQQIYQRAWQALSDEAKNLLEAMPLIGEPGALPEQMQAVCELDDAAFWNAVNELIGRSLLEVRGTTWERRYGIHRLTETFLQTEINKWPGIENDD